MKKFFKEFKEFALKGNVMDMAVGVIIGSAFANIVTALTEDFINQLINGIGGAEVAGTIKIYGGQVIKYGDFITSVINFVIMAFVLFMLLKVFNMFSSKYLFRCFFMSFTFFGFSILVFVIISYDLAFPVMVRFTIFFFTLGVILLFTSYSS